MVTFKAAARSSIIILTIMHVDINYQNLHLFGVGPELALEVGQRAKESDARGEAVKPQTVRNRSKKSIVIRLTSRP